MSCVASRQEEEIRRLKAQLVDTSLASRPLHTRNATDAQSPSLSTTSATTSNTAAASKKKTTTLQTPLETLVQKWAAHFTVFYSPYINRASFLQPLPTYTNPWAAEHFEKEENLASGHMAELLHSAAGLPEIAMLLEYTQEGKYWSLDDSETTPMIVKKVSLSCYSIKPPTDIY